MEKTFTTFQIAKIANVLPATVRNWTNKGKLRSHRTPGGHRRVILSDLLSFLRLYNMPIPDDLSNGIIKDDVTELVKSVMADNSALCAELAHVDEVLGEIQGNRINTILQLKSSLEYYKTHYELIQTDCASYRRTTEAAESELAAVKLSLKQANNAMELDTKARIVTDA